MSSVNKVFLLGRLGKDPEVRYTPAGKALASFSMATSETWKDGNGEKQERTEWHKIVAWGRLGEICGEYLRKGSQVHVEGRLQTRKWEDKQGATHYSTEIVIENMVMLGSGEAKRNQASGQGGQSEEPASIPDDDIPF